MSVIKVPTSFNIDVEFEIPEFYRRLIALVIDILVIIIYKKVADWLFSIMVLNSVKKIDINTWYDVWGLSLLFGLPIFLYHIVCEVAMNGQSIGKKIMNLKVVSENGSRPSFSQYIIRWVLRDIWFLLLLLLGFYLLATDSKTEGGIVTGFVICFFIAEVVLVVSTPKGQRIGDILAHTILIKASSKADIGETVFQEVQESYVPSFPEIMRLSDKDINAVKSILETARKKGDYNLAATAADKIKDHLNIRNSMSPFDFLDIVLKDYNYLSVK